MFDPYHRWLGIPKSQQPPTYYQLLGISPDETDAEVIQEAALRQTSHVRLYQTGPHAAQCTAILNEIAQARAVLLNQEKRKQYDATLTRPANVELVAAPPPPPVPPMARQVPVEEAPVVTAGRVRDPAVLGPAFGFVALLLLGAALAFVAGLSRSGVQADPAVKKSAPTPAPVSTPRRGKP